jgi:hypothetical protein
MTRSFGYIVYTWKGELALAPANPVQNWVYRNTTDKIVYLYDAGEWKIMARDGVDGDDGKNGYSPQVTVKTDTADEYVLEIIYQKPDGTLDAYTTPNLRGIGVGDYEKLKNKPQIAGISLEGDITLSDLRIQPAKQKKTCTGNGNATRFDIAGIPDDASEFEFFLNALPLDADDYTWSIESGSGYFTAVGFVPLAEDRIDIFYYTKL